MLYWSQHITPVVTPLKFYMVFLNSAINPFTYGYGNETMQKAFRITFPFLYKDKVSYILDLFSLYKIMTTVIFSQTSNYKKELDLEFLPSKKPCPKSIRMLKQKLKNV